MKKNYTLTFILTLCFNILVFAQTPIITSIIDGDCSGGNPKMLELYANGTVDFSLYTLQNQTNSNTSWGNNQSLSELGTITDAFVYISTSGSADAIGTEFPSITNSTSKLISNTINLNGDDRVTTILASDSSVVDQYGVSSEDGTGKSWEYTDSFAKRVDGTSANGSFVESNWTFAGTKALDKLGVCQGGDDTFEVLIGGIGTYSTSTASLKNNPISGFATYPNPVSDGILNISTASTSVKEVTIFNLLGKQVFSSSFSGVNKNIDVSSINAGMYILKVTEEGKMATKKLIIR